MEPKDFKNLLDQAYSTPNTDGELSKLLANIHEVYENTYTQKLEADKQKADIELINNELSGVNEKLRSVNMDLFLKIGSAKPSENPFFPKEEPKVPITDLYT